MPPSPRFVFIVMVVVVIIIVIVIVVVIVIVIVIVIIIVIAPTIERYPNGDVDPILRDLVGMGFRRQIPLVCSPYLYASLYVYIF